MTSVMNSAIATRPPIGPIANVIAKGYLMVVTAWLGGILICALSGAVLHWFGQYAWHIQRALVTAWVLFSIGWVWGTDLNKY